VDHTGSVLAAGFDAAPAGSKMAAFIAKYDAQGRRVWRLDPSERLRSTENPPRTSASAVATDPSGKVFALVWSAGPGSRLFTANPDGSNGTLRPLPSAARYLELGPSAELLYIESASANPGSATGSADVLVLLDPGGALVHKSAESLPKGWASPVWGGSKDRRVLFAGSSASSELLSTQRGLATEHLHWRCTADGPPCQRKARGLFARLQDVNGHRLWEAAVGSPSADFAATGAIAGRDGSGVLTGTFTGNIALGPILLCELEPGERVTVRRQQGFVETGHHSGCDCLDRRRDLFVLGLSSRGDAVWAKTAAIGQDPAAVSLSDGMSFVWAALVRSSSEDKHDDVLLVRHYGWDGRLLAAHVDPRERSSPRLATNGSTVYVSGGGWLSRVDLKP
jgi:hypothetical protein